MQAVKWLISFRIIQPCKISLQRGGNLNNIYLFKASNDVMKRCLPSGKSKDSLRVLASV